MQRITVNACYGGFGLSYAGVMEYARRAGLTIYAYDRDRSKGNGFDHYVPHPPDSDEGLFTTYATALLNPDGTLPPKTHWSYSDISRNDPHLIATVEALGSEKASGKCAELKIVEIPDDVEWQIGEYDGMETVEESHRSWS